MVSGAFGGVILAVIEGLNIAVTKYFAKVRTKQCRALFLSPATDPSPRLLTWDRTYLKPFPADGSARAHSDGGPSRAGRAAVVHPDDRAGPARAEGRGLLRPQGGGRRRRRAARVPRGTGMGDAVRFCIPVSGGGCRAMCPDSELAIGGSGGGSPPPPRRAPAFARGRPSRPARVRKIRVPARTARHSPPRILTRLGVAWVVSLGPGWGEG